MRTAEDGSTHMEAARRAPPSGRGKRQRHGQGAVRVSMVVAKEWEGGSKYGMCAVCPRETACRRPRPLPRGVRQC